MKVDISKYNSWFKTIKFISREDFLKIKESCQLGETTDYIEDLDYFRVTARTNKSNDGFNYPSYKKITEKYTIDFPDKELYIPYENIPYKIPFEYYSKAYIHPLDLSIPLSNEDFIPRELKFELDCCGRLHVYRDCVLNFIYCIEKKIPEISAEVYPSNIKPTLENQVDLANKYLSPYFIVEKNYENIFDYLAKPDTTAYKILKEAPLLNLELFSKYLEKGKYFKHLAGYIFEDGSYLMFSDDIIYHEVFNKYISMKSRSYTDYHWIKLIGEKFNLNKIFAVYYGKNITIQQKQTLNKLKKHTYIEDMDLDNTFVKYYKIKY